MIFMFFFTAQKFFIRTKRTVAGGIPKSPGIVPRVGEILKLYYHVKELALQEMNEVKGGVTQEEYCNTIGNLMYHNWDDWNETEQNSWVTAYFTHCYEG